MSEKRRTSSGVESLDQILDGLFIGDNVIWCDDAGSLAPVFCHNFLEASRAQGKPIIYSSFDRPPRTLLDRLGSLANYPELTVLDCFTGGKGRSSPIFTKFYDQPRPADHCQVIRVDDAKDMDRFMETLYHVHGQLTGDVRLVFDSLTGMQELWGGEEQLIGFYSHSCPRLYELETIAYWIMEKEAHSSRLRARISQIAQVVIELTIKRGTTMMTVIKADDRDIQNLHHPFIYWTKGASVTLSMDRRTAPDLDLGHRLKLLRSKKGLSQTELARQVGVTPSTISQVESNLIYPSLPALLKMAEALTVEVSSFFRETGQARQPVLFNPGEALSVRLPGLSPEDGLAVRLTPVDLDAKVEPFLIEINPGRTLDSHFMTHKGEELGYLLSGRLAMRFLGQTLTVNPGDMLYLSTDTPDWWRNTGNEPARLLWFKVR